MVRSTACRYGANASTTSDLLRCRDPDGTERDIHRLEVRGGQLAVPALLVVQPLRGTGSDGDADVQRGDRRGPPLGRGPLVDPAASSLGMGRQHPVEQHTVSERATEATELRSHRADDDTGVGQQAPKLGHRRPHRLQRWPQPP